MYGSFSHRHGVLRPSHRGNKWSQMDINNGWTYRVPKAAGAAWTTLSLRKERGRRRPKDFNHPRNPVCCFPRSPGRDLPARWTPEQRVCRPRARFLLRGAEHRWSELSGGLSPRTRDPSGPSGQSGSSIPRTLEWGAQGCGDPQAPVWRTGEEILSALANPTWDNDELTSCSLPPTSAPRTSAAYPSIQTSGWHPRTQESPSIISRGSRPRHPQRPSTPRFCAPSQERDSRLGQGPFPLSAYRGRFEHVHSGWKRLHGGRGPRSGRPGWPSAPARPHLLPVRAGPRAFLP